MELEGSLPWPQEPSTGPYPDPDQCSPYHTIISLVRYISEPALYKLTIFHVPNLKAIFLSLGNVSKESVQGRDSFKRFVTS
jgi:hypothetical protein